MVFMTSLACLIFSKFVKHMLKRYLPLLGFMQNKLNLLSFKKAFNFHLAMLALLMAFLIRHLLNICHLSPFNASLA